VLLELTDKAREAIDAIWGPYIRNAETLFANYSVADLKAILRHLQEGSLAKATTWPMSRRCASANATELRVSHLLITSGVIASACSRAHIGGVCRMLRQDGDQNA